MDWAQVLVIFLGNAALVVSLFFWNRSESRSDMRHMLAIVDAIKDEMKDFHGRLCAIEEKNRSK